MEHDTIAIRHRDGLDGALDIVAIGKGRLIEGGVWQSRLVLCTAGVVGDSGGIPKFLS